ncbi:MAG: DMT family transporter [Thermodesulfobacteriota bacterium]
MNLQVLKANLLLFTAAVVWGGTFVAQRAGMDNLGPLAYTGVRFLLGSLFLFPLAWLRRHQRPPDFLAAGRNFKIRGGILAGLIMFIGINLQQIGLVQTTAGKAGFITGLYVILVPLLGLALGRRPGAGVWLGVTLAASGLYLLSVTEAFTLAPGDGWVLVCALVWAVHVWIIGWLSPKMDAFVLAFGQAFVCALLSLAAAGLAGEAVTLAAIEKEAGPLAWGGIMSVAFGFTLQVMGQKESPPAHAAVIMSLESVFAAVSGWIILAETMSPRGLGGAGLMLAGALIAQLWPRRRIQTGN